MAVEPAGSESRGLKPGLLLASGAPAGPTFGRMEDDDRREGVAWPLTLSERRS